MTFEEFEKGVKESYIEAKLGDRIHQMAEVDLHFVLPLMAYARYQDLIREITDGDFHVSAGYNLVLLYTDPAASLRAGTVLFGRELDGIVGAWSNVLEDIAKDRDKEVRLQKFKNAHAHFRGALWARENPGCPCASSNPPIPKARPLGKRFWQ